MPCVVAEAQAALSQGMCVVIGLQSTGEAAADAIGLEPGPVPGFVSTTKELLYRLVEAHFPTREERLDEHGGWLAGVGAAGDSGAAACMQGAGPGAAACDEGVVLLCGP